MRTRGAAGLRLLGVMTMISLVAIGCWTYVRLARTSTIRDTWPAGPGEAYATIDHTAPWSEPWTKLCRIDSTTHAERWCRTVPDGEHVQSAITEGDDVVVRLDTREWRLDVATGANLP